MQVPVITLTINGREIKLDKPVTVLEAARMAGIKIPTLCHHELLEPYGGCRLCVVEVEKMPKLQTACTLMATDGMVVRTESEAIAKARRGVLEFLLINHPLDCPVCDKAGECELQDAVMRYGPSAGRFREDKRRIPESHDDPLLARNLERCIACTRCVRMCETVQGASAITMVGRGGRTVMQPFSSKAFNCEYCGNCLTVCPVGSILSRTYIHSYRPWQIDRETQTICGYCGVGCSLIVQSRDEAIKRVIPRVGLGLNRGLLCSRGRFGYDFTRGPDRLSTPLIRKNGRLEEATWDEALGLVAERLLQIKEKNGGSSIAGIASPRCTNEENYLFQKFMRTVCETNNIDSISRMGLASAQRYLEALLGQGITANSIDDIKRSDVVLVMGGDPTAINPILGLSIREASRNGARVAILGYAPGLERFRTIKVLPPLLREAEVLELLLKEVFSLKGPRGNMPELDKRIETASGEPSLKEGLSGFDDLKEALLSSKSLSIVLGMDLVQRSNGHRALFAVAGLVYLLGARLYLLSERPNEQGLVDMGCMPDLLPGGKPLSSTSRKEYEEAWGHPVTADKGLTLMEIIEGARNKEIKAIYIMGENPVFNLPDSAYVREALSCLEFMVVQDIFLSETARTAHVVLPALGWSEKTGTYTNLERRIQLLRKAVHSVSGREDWRIIADLSSRMGYRMGYRDEEEIMKEISRVSPLYRGISYKDIENGGCLWPYKAEPSAEQTVDIPTVPIEGHDYRTGPYLSLERVPFHSGTLSRRSSALRRISPEPLLKIGPQHAERLGLKNGDRVKVSTEKGSLVVPVSIDKTIEDERLFLSNNIEDRGVFSLMVYSLDPVTRAPGIEGCEVRIEKLQESE